MNNVTINQHTIPKCYQKGWSRKTPFFLHGKLRLEDSIWVLNEETKIISNKRISETTTIPSFYEVDHKIKDWVTSHPYWSSEECWKHLTEKLLPDIKSSIEKEIELFDVAVKRTLEQSLSPLFQGIDTIISSPSVEELSTVNLIETSVLAKAIEDSGAKILSALRSDPQCLSSLTNQQLVLFLLFVATLEFRTEAISKNYKKQLEYRGAIDSKFNISIMHLGMWRTILSLTRYMYDRCHSGNNNLAPTILQAAPNTGFVISSHPIISSGSDAIRRKKERALAQVEAKIRFAISKNDQRKYDFYSEKKNEIQRDFKSHNFIVPLSSNYALHIHNAINEHWAISNIPSEAKSAGFYEMDIRQMNQANGYYLQHLKDGVSSILIAKDYSHLAMIQRHLGFNPLFVLGQRIHPQPSYRTLVYADRSLPMIR